MKLTPLLLSIFMLLSGVARATPIVQMQSNTDISKRNECDSPEDKVTLSIVDNGKRLAGKTYCSTFGDSKADLATDSRGRLYLLIEYRTGRTSEGTEDYLEIDRLDHELKRVFQTQVTGITGPSAHFWYTYKIQTPKFGGLTLTFLLHADHNSECCVPAQKRRVVRIDTR